MTASLCGAWPGTNEQQSQHSLRTVRSMHKMQATLPPAFGSGCTSGTDQGSGSLCLGICRALATDS